MSDDITFQQLCQSQIEGIASDDERAELASILNTSDEARRSYAEQMRIHALLAWQHGRAQPVLVQRTSEKILRFKQWRWLAVAAALVILGTLSALWLGRESDAEVSFEVLAASDVPFQPGEQVKSRRIEIEHGSLSVRIISGAVVDVTGPVTMELLSPMHVRLLRGRLTADVGTKAKGFVVDTAEAHVVDLGTRFGVKTGAAHATDIAVFEGSVEVYKPARTTAKALPDATLIEGEAVRVERSQQPRRLKVIWLGKDARSLGVSRESDIVNAVTDNVTDDSVRGYYGLLRGGMDEGALVYTTGHTRTWHPLPGGIFPEELKGADAICTFGMDGRDANLQLTLVVAKPCDLYVMADARGPAPEWLRNGFTDTGLQLRSGPWIPRAVPKENYASFYKDETVYVPYRVWKRRIATPGSVVLGSPVAESKNRNPAMYGIAVKGVP